MIDDDKRFDLCLAKETYDSCYKDYTRSAEEDYSDESFSAFVKAQLLLIVQRDGVRLNENLNAYAPAFRRSDKGRKRWLRLLSAHRYYLQGHFHAAYYILSKELSKEVSRLNDKKHYAACLESRYAVLLSLLAGKVISRMGDQEMARLHLGHAFTICRRLKTTDTLKYYLQGRIMIAFMRTHLDSSSLEFCEDLLEKAKRYFDRALLFIGHKEALVIQGSHACYFEIAYLNARLIAKRSEKQPDWMKQVAIYDGEMRRIAASKSGSIREGMDHRRLYLDGYVNLKKGESLVFKAAGTNEKNAANDFLHEAANSFRQLLDQQEQYSERDYGPRRIRTLNMLCRTLRLTTRRYRKSESATYSDQNEATVKAIFFQLDLYIAEATRLNRLGNYTNPGDQPPGGTCVNYRQAFKTAKQKMAVLIAYQISGIDQNGKIITLKDVFTEFDKAHELLTSNFEYLTSYIAHNSFYYDFRTLQEAILEVCYNNEASKEISLNTSRKKAVTAVVRSNTYDYQVVKKGTRVVRRKNKTSLPKQRKLAKSFHQLLLQSIELTEKTKSEKFRRLDSLIAFTYREHFKRLSKVKMNNALKHIAHTEELLEVSQTEIGHAFIDQQPVAIYEIFSGRKHIYAVCYVRDKGEKVPILSLRRLTTKSYQDQQTFQKAVKDMNNICNLIIKRSEDRRNGSQVKSLDFEDSHNKCLVDKAISVSRKLWNRLDIPLEIDRIYFIFDNNALHDLFLPLLILPEFEVGKYKLINEVPWVGLKYKLSQTNSLLDFLDKDKRPNGTKKEDTPLPARPFLHTIMRVETSPTGEDEGKSALAGYLRILRDRYQKILGEYLSLNGGGHLPFDLTNEESSEKDKKGLLKKIEQAGVYLIAAHQEKEGSQNNSDKLSEDDHHRLSKLVLCWSDAAREAQDAKGTTSWENALETTPLNMYHDDIDQLDLHRLSLAIIAACFSTIGKQQPANLPRSITAAFNRAGCKTVLGTSFRLHGTDTYLIVIRLLECWLSVKASSQNGQQTENETPTDNTGSTFGDALLESSKQLNADEVHPLIWGGVKAYGTLTTTAASAFATVKASNKKS